MSNLVTSEEKKIRHWSKDPGFWVVVISFVLFLSVAAAIVFSKKNFHLSQQGAFLDSDESTPKSLPHAIQFSIDARNPKKWIYFNLSEKRIVHPRFVSSTNWDLAFKRYHVIANGGAANLAADGGIRDLGAIDLTHLPKVPQDQYVKDTRTQDGRGIENAAIRHWYLYDYASHILTPMSHVYGVRTPGGRYFAFRILNYYCSNGQSGCVTLEISHI